LSLCQLVNRKKRLTADAPSTQIKGLQLYASQVQPTKVRMLNAITSGLVERAGKVAKLGLHVHPHMLRHATGYVLANEGTDTRLIQDFLGHASIANTVRYSRLAPGRLAAVPVR
jgi:site-specific recombinase XerD